MLTNLLDIDESTDEFIKSVKNIANQIGMISKVNNKTGCSRLWFDADCVMQKSKLKKLIKKCKKEKFENSETVILYNNEKKNYNNIKKMKKESHTKSIIDQLTYCRNSETFWKIINRFRFKNYPKNNVDFETWQKYFTDFFQNADLHPESFMSRIINKNTNEKLEKPINKEEIITVLLKCKNNKSPGSDEISFEFFKNLPDKWIDFMSLIFNQILTEEKVPKTWSKIYLTMIHKKGDASKPENYRPIALTNCITKLFTNVLTNRIIQWVEGENLIPEFQSGFRRDRSCIDNIFVLNALVQKRLNLKGGKLFALFVDFKNAFPSISHKILWEKLYKVGLGYKIIKIFMDFYAKANVSVKYNGKTSKAVNVTKGVLQGEVSSPLLFSLFMSDLEEFLKLEGINGVSIDHQTEIIHLAYADDIVLFAESYVKLQKILKSLRKYCLCNELEVNESKTKIIIYGKGGHAKSRNYNFKYGDVKIDIVKNYIYLGIQQMQNASSKGALKNAITSAKLAASSTLSLINKMKVDIWETIPKLFDSLVSSTLFYAIQIWGLRFLQEIEKIQTTFYKKLLLIPPNTPGYAIRLETGVTSLSTKVFKLTLNLIEKILNMESNRLPKICLLKLISLAKTKKNTYKYNWCKHVENIFETIEETLLWDHQYIKENKCRLIEKYNNSLQDKDVNSLGRSQSLQILPHLDLRVGTQLYLK